MSVTIFFKWIFALGLALITLISADIKSGYKLNVAIYIYSLMIILIGMTFYGAIYL
jgi:hypothetical protein